MRAPVHKSGRILPRRNADAAPCGAALQCGAEKNGRRAQCSPPNTQISKRMGIGIPNSQSSK